MATILGEPNPGFNLWTSAHGYHHLSLTQSNVWKVFWAVVIAIASIALVACIIYYFYYVFAFAVYSRITQETPISMNWPTTIVCDRQIFSLAKLAQVQPLTNSHASILSWSISPMLARPDVMNLTRVPQIGTEITTALSNSRFNTINYAGGSMTGGPMDQLLKAIAPNCSQLILQCTTGNATMNGFDCCATLFNPTPYFTPYGTCYSTRGGRVRPQVLFAGDAGSLTIVTMHDLQSPFDASYASSRLIGVSGLAFAVVDDNVTVEQAMASKGQTVLPGNMASVGLSRTVIDNRDLEWSAIAPSKCITPGNRDPRWVDADLIYGVEPSYGYSMDACTSITKREMISREILGCTFNPLPADTNIQRCNGNQSVSYYRSFLDNNRTSTPEIPVYTVDNKNGLRPRYEKRCMPDCLIDRYALSSTYNSLTEPQKQNLQPFLTSSGQVIPGSNPSLVMLKLYMGSLEYQRIYNFPQPGLQFVAEIGGLMAFLLGISVISIIECLCFCCCCGCRKSNEDEN